MDRVTVGMLGIRGSGLAFRRAEQRLWPTGRPATPIAVCPQASSFKDPYVMGGGNFIAGGGNTADQTHALIASLTQLFPDGHWGCVVDNGERSFPPDTGDGNACRDAGKKTLCSQKHILCVELR